MTQDEVPDAAVEAALRAWDAPLPGDHRRVAMRDAIAAAWTEMERAQWKPVEEAPFGIDLLLYCPERGIANRERMEMGWAGSLQGGWRHSWATLFRRLPSPPARRTAPMSERDNGAMWPTTPADAEAAGRVARRCQRPLLAPNYDREALRARWRIGWKKEDAAIETARIRGNWLDADIARAQRGERPSTNGPTRRVFGRRGDE